MIEGMSICIIVVSAIQGLLAAAALIAVANSLFVVFAANSLLVLPPVWSLIGVGMSLRVALQGFQRDAAMKAAGVNASLVAACCLILVRIAKEGLLMSVPIALLIGPPALNAALLIWGAAPAKPPAP